MRSTFPRTHGRLRHNSLVSPVADNPVIVPDRNLEQEKKPAASEPPRLRCPLCGWSPRKEDKWFCTCGNEWNTFGRRLPSVPPPMV